MSVGHHAPDTTVRAAVTSGHAAPLLDVRDVRTRFPTARGLVHAVDGVSFQLRRGETVGIVGESGSGKSALARTIMGLAPRGALVSGDVLFDGRDLRTLDARTARQVLGTDLAMVFQDPMRSLNPVVRVGRQIAEVLRLHLGMGRAPAAARAIELLEEVGIPEPVRRSRCFPHELSGGMRQRVCIAIAVACAPKLLLADEPTTALDVTIQRQILDLLAELRASNGMAMILITHDLGVVARRAERTMVMYAGQVVETGPTGTLFAETRHHYTKALLASIPRLRQRSHTRLSAIPGRPVDVIEPAAGCRFAPRCPAAQDRCLVEDPVLSASSATGHAFSCFYSLGTPQGEEALRRNRSAGHTAAGLPIEPSSGGPA